MLQAETVGSAIVEWHSCIIARDIDSAKAAREKTIIAVNKMEPDDKMLTYYQLVSFQHDLLISYPDKEMPETPSLNENEIERNDYLNYMYYYVTGQNEYLSQRYKSAIRTYKVAERLLDKVNDPYEKADFYQKLGISYYRINQYTFAISYIEQALEIFEKNNMYQVNEITCKMVLAVISTEINHFDTAEAIFKELLQLTKAHPYQHALTLHNLGLNRIFQEQYEEAISCFNNALTIEEFTHSMTALKSTYYMYNLEMRLGTYSTGFDRLESQISEVHLPEFNARCKVTKGLYLESDLSLVQSGLDMLEENEQYFELALMYEEIAQFFETKGDLAKALEYYKLANIKSKTQTIVGVDQV